MTIFDSKKAEIPNDCGSNFSTKTSDADFLKSLMFAVVIFGGWKVIKMIKNDPPSKISEFREKVVKIDKNYFYYSVSGDFDPPKKTPKNSLFWQNH